MIFEWDESKSLLNKIKHGIDFDVASLVFEDPYLLSELDERYSSEERWKSSGFARNNLIYVAHTVGDYHEEEVIRIISARKVNSKETRRYYINRSNERATSSAQRH